MTLKGIFMNDHLFAINYATNLNRITRFLGQDCPLTVEYVIEKKL